ncbi:DUF1707 domain-containing protein [Blastococcus sp. HT6-30]|uniref:DUF1707 SHOCT-like domain-containing protein n=1 Tax=Blastococcus sp. HT6-30 TaxID=3144843 RepID=UPI00321BB16F
MSEGRLTVAEYDERLAQAYAARTFGELAPLTTDLPNPADAPAPGPRRPPPIGRRRRPPAWPAGVRTGGRHGARGRPPR